MNDLRPTELELATALRAHLPAASRADLRDRIHLATATVPQQRALPSFLGPLTDADPNARQRAVLIAAAALVAAALAGVVAVGALRQEEQPILPTGGMGRLAFVKDSDLYLANPDGSNPVPVVHADGAQLSDPRWSNDGRLIAVQTPEPAILLLDVRTGSFERLTSGTIGAWSPDGRSLAYLSTNGDIAVVDIESGVSRLLVAKPDGTDGFGSEYATSGNDPLVWSPDGRWLAANGAPSLSELPFSLIRIDVASGATEVLDTTTDYYQYQADWAPDSERIVFGGWSDRNVPDMVWVSKADGSGMSEIRDQGGMIHPDWSPDGEWIAYVSLSRAERPDELRIVRPNGTGSRRLAANVAGIVGWSRDGGSLAFTVGTDDENRSELHVVNVADGADRVVPVPDGGNFAFAGPVVAAPTDSTAPSPPAAVASEPPELPIEAPPVGPPLQPDSSWGGIAFRTAVEEFDCYIGVLRFPDQFTVIEPQREEAGSSADPVEAAGPTSAPQQADMCELPFAPDGSSFARASQRDASLEVVRLDGTRKLGPVPWEVGSTPVWSPGGGWLVMPHCDESGDCSRAIITRPDGSGRRELTGQPLWSPGDRLVAVTEADGTLLVGNGDGTDLRAIGTFPRPSGWSPDSSTFVFVRDGDAWLTRADGSGVRNLTEFPLGGATKAFWSPDGRWILVLQGSTMWAFSPDGSVRQRLGANIGPTDGSWGPAWAPAWSPDGEWVALEHGQQVTLFHSGDWRGVRLENAFQPAWSLDGRHLAVVADANGQYQVDVLNPDGTGRVTVSNATSYPPIAWIR